MAVLVRMGAAPVESPPPSPQKEQRWMIETSIFAPRVKEADCRGFVDGDSSSRVVTRALSRDWNRLLKTTRFTRFIEKHDDDGDQEDDAEIGECRTVLAKHYATVLSLFTYYSGIAGTRSTKGAFSIQENQYASLLADCDVPDDEDDETNTNPRPCVMEVLSGIFVAVNVEVDKTSAESALNENRALMRHEFIEALVRIAVAKFGHVEVSCGVVSLLPRHPAVDGRVPP